MNSEFGMIITQIKARGIKDERIINAMLKVERRRFVPTEMLQNAYDDKPVPIGYGQTISQPYVTALMIEMLEVKKEDTVLEIGTGSGYQSAILSLLGHEVYSLEIVPELAHTARQRLLDMGYTNVHVRTGDGYYGWPELSPFDKIILSAAPGEIPNSLLEQIKYGGRLIVPLGAGDQQELVVINRMKTYFTKNTKTRVRFVPMTGKVEHA